MNQRGPVFAQNAVLPITVVCALLFVLGGFIWWLASQNSKLETVVTDVKLIKEALAKRDAEGVSHQDMRIFIRLLQRDNPTLKVADWFK